MDTLASHLARLAECVEKEPPIIVVMKNVLATISPSHDMMKGSC